MLRQKHRKPVEDESATLTRRRLIQGALATGGILGLTTSPQLPSFAQGGPREPTAAGTGPALQLRRD
jgi:hypothetical protein